MPVDHDHPIFVICTGRSGSTLLRALLNSHPDVACPPETNIAAAFVAIQRAMWSVSSDGPSASGELPAPSPAADELCREVARALFEPYAKKYGKTYWCDKSLVSIESIPLLAHLYPHGRFVCLYRDSLDTMASLLEASPFGLSHFGLEPYAKSSPANFVQATALYWADRVETMLELEATAPEDTFRVRYEDLVAEPSDVCKAMFSFLGLKWHSAYIERDRVFGQGDLGTTLGDHKIRYTKEISKKSIGRGWRIPVAMLPPPILERVNALGRLLGYDALDARHAPALDHAVDGTGRRKWGGVDELVAQQLRPRLSERLRANGDDQCVPRMVVAFRDSGSRWTIDFDRRTVRISERHTEARKPPRNACVVVTDQDTLVDIANGAVNPATAIHAGRIQLSHPQDMPPMQRWHHMHRLVDLLW